MEYQVREILPRQMDWPGCQDRFNVILVLLNALLRVSDRLTTEAVVGERGMEVSSRRPTKPYTLRMISNDIKP